MHRRVPFVILLVASAAAAQPKPRAPAAKVPMRWVPCLPDNATLHATGDEAVVCWDKGCMKLDFENTDASWIVKPPAPKQWMLPQPEVKDDQVCLGTTCKKLGKKLIAALAEFRKDLPKEQLSRIGATSDLKTVIVNYGAWNVATDSSLKLTAPRLYAKTGEKPAVAGTQAAGNLLVVDWGTCAGPCTKFSITDSSGRPKGPEGDGGGDVFQLDAKRFVVVSEYATIAIFELATGKARGVVRLDADPASNWTVRGDDTTLFTMFTKNDGAQIVKISADDDPQVLPSVRGSMFLPKCLTP